MGPSSYPTRKLHRLKDYDYSSPGAYFVTICTKERRMILSRIAVGTTIGIPPDIVLSPLGRIVDAAVRRIPEKYPSTELHQYVIMPNHIHLLLSISSEGGPALGRILQQMKGYVTKQWGQSVWQDKYYDHVIRDENDFLVRYQYILNNPAKWSEDEYYGAP